MTKPDKIEESLQLLGGLLVLPWVDDPSDADPCYGNGNGYGYDNGYGNGNGNGNGYGYSYGYGFGYGYGDGDCYGNSLRRMLE